MITTRPKSVPPSPTIVQPVTVFDRVSTVPAESAAARIITSGADSAGVCATGNGGSNNDTRTVGVSQWNVSNAVPASI
jgi:hypothetical protein